MPSCCAQFRCIQGQPEDISRAWLCIYLHTESPPVVRVHNSRSQSPEHVTWCYSAMSLLVCAGHKMASSLVLLLTHKMASSTGLLQLHKMASSLGFLLLHRDTCCFSLLHYLKPSLQIQEWESLTARLG